MSKKTELSLDEEMLMWTSYRYCIGRKTYVNSLASYMAKKYYPLMSESQRQKAAFDIRRTIGDCLQFTHPAFKYDGTISDNERNYLVDLTMWLNTNITKTEDLHNIEKIICYKEGYNEKYEKKYDVYRHDREWKHIYDHDIDDLIVWESLASLMDVKKHKMITVKNNDKTEAIECFETIEKQVTPIEGEPGYYQNVNWRWQKCYKPVEWFLKYGEYCASLNEENVIKIEDL